jgi:hypothetical protein
MMNTLLLHPYEYLRTHVHPAIAADRVKLRTSYLRELFAFVDKAVKIALVIGMAYLALAGFEKIAASATLTAHYCDLCAVLPVMLVAP